MVQNTSHAVMAQRTEAADSLDDFPTPPWATRAFCEHILGGSNRLKSQSVWEPACGRGDMAQVLGEYFNQVKSSDVFDYGYGSCRDFLTGPIEPDSVDWVITNPPFKAAEKFYERAIIAARRGVALLTRTVFIESVGRYERVFLPHPPSAVAQYVERVPMVKGRLDRKASTATGYAWLVWERDAIGPTLLKWVPPSRKQLEQRSDYEPGFRMKKLAYPAKGNTLNLSDIHQRDLFAL